MENSIFIGGSNEQHRKPLPYNFICCICVDYLRYISELNSQTLEISPNEITGLPADEENIAKMPILNRHTHISCTNL